MSPKKSYPSTVLLCYIPSSLVQVIERSRQLAGTEAPTAAYPSHLFLSLSPSLISRKVDRICFCLFVFYCEMICIVLRLALFSSARSRNQITLICMYVPVHKPQIRVYLFAINQLKPSDRICVAVQRNK